MNQIRSDRSIYQLLEKHLRAAQYAMTCSNLMDIHEIRREALKEYGGADKDVRIATNKLSDILGFMWRRGVLTRYPAPATSGSFARFAYVWDQKEDARPVAPILTYKEPIRSRKANPVAAHIEEHDDGTVEIEFEKFTIFITPK